MSSKKEAMFWEPLSGGRVRCYLCPRYCKINTGHYGICGVRQNVDGKLYTLIYGKVSSLNNDPIEKKPLFHFYPGTTVLSAGTLGCNMMCLHCQNWQISRVSFDGERKKTRVVDERAVEDVSPEKLVELTLGHRSAGIAWTYNEPIIWFEYTYDAARLAKEKNLYTVYVTNGYITFDALDTIGPYLDAFRVDIKGFTPEFYKKLAMVADFKPVLDATVRAKNKWGMHVEIVTNVIPTMNDDEEQLRGIAGWIRSNLGAETPWHVTRFVPHLELSHLPATPVETLEKARDIGFKAGLHYIYVGNVAGHRGENTYCFNCKKLLIGRFGFGIEEYHVAAGKCEYCGTKLEVFRE